MCRYQVSLIWFHKAVSSIPWPSWLLFIVLFLSGDSDLAGCRHYSLVYVIYRQRLACKAAKTCRLACLLALDVRTHNPTATGASMVTRPTTNPVPVVCSGIPWVHDTAPAYLSDSLRPTSMSPLCWHHDTTSAVDSSGYPWRPRLSGGCSTWIEQSATRDSGLLLTFDIPEGEQVSPFSSVIWLTWRRLLRWSADVCIELCNSFISTFCKVPRNYVMAAL